jgi:hypothetical protein
LSVYTGPGFPIYTLKKHNFITTTAIIYKNHFELSRIFGFKTFNNWFQNTLPVIGAMDISMAKKRSLNITELVKTKYRVITGTSNR